MGRNHAAYFEIIDSYDMNVLTLPNILTGPPILGKLYDLKWIHYNPIVFLEDNNLIARIQYGGVVVEWYNSGEKYFSNDPITFLGFY